jgi:hypothetical protein
MRSTKLELPKDDINVGGRSDYSVNIVQIKTVYCALLVEIKKLHARYTVRTYT